MQQEAQQPTPSGTEGKIAILDQKQLVENLSQLRQQLGLHVLKQANLLGSLANAEQRMTEKVTTGLGFVEEIRRVQKITGLINDLLKSEKGEN